MPPKVKKSKSTNKKSTNNLKKLLVLFIKILLIVYVVMNIFQLKLDRSRRISMHCYIRNVAIVFAVYYLIHYKWNWWVFALPFIVELIIEIGHTYNFFQLDPEENKTINCYNWFEKASRVHPELDYYTEGYNQKHDLSVSMKEAQENKFEWMCDQGKINKGTRVLDIGSGRCDFLYYAKNHRGANVTGCTISPDQISTCKKKEIPVFLIDITNDPIPEKYKGKFDVLVFNGSAEHFRQCNNPKSIDKFWEDFFKKMEVLFDPNSTNKRIVITMIHHRRKKSFSEKIDDWVLDKGFGGSYPNGKYGLVKNAQNYKVLTMKDATEEYLLYSKKLSQIGYTPDVLQKIVYNHVIDLPISLANNPYYFYNYWSTHGPWTRQFKPVDGKKPPMLHQWIILQKK